MSTTMSTTSLNRTFYGIENTPYSQCAQNLFVLIVPFMELKIHGRGSRYAAGGS